MYFNYEPVIKGDTRVGIEQIEWAYVAIRDHFGGDPNQSHRAFMLWSPGPDRTDNNLYWVDYAPESPVFLDLTYDPTNGTVSLGDMGRLGGNYRSQLVNKD